MGDPSKILILEAVLQSIETDDLLSHVCHVGNYLLCELNTLQHEFPHLMNSVRGRGFIIAFDMPCNDTKNKFLHLIRSKGNIKLLIYIYIYIYISKFIYSIFKNKFAH